MPSPLIKIDFLVETNIIGESNKQRSKWVPAVDVLSIEESTRFQGMSEVLLTGSVRPDTGVPFIMVCAESAQSLADRINSLFGYEGVGKISYAPAVAENSHAQPEAVDVEVAPV